MRPMTNKKTRRCLQNKNKVGLEQDLIFFFIINKTFYKAQTRHPCTLVKTGNKSCMGQTPS